MKKHEFLWFDLETTGLDPEEDHVLEFAAVLCEDARGDDFDIVESYSGVIAPDDALVMMNDFVRDMHTRNDLLAEVETSTTTIDEVDMFLADLASRLTGGRKHALRLAGSSVHFDLSFVRMHMSRFSDYVSHRILDVSTLWAAIDAWSPHDVVRPPRNAHRALPDVMATIEEARIARRAMGWIA